MLRAAFAALALWAAPANADRAQMLEALGGQGCVIGADATSDLRVLAGEALRDGTASRQGDWVLLSSELCTIRPPQLETVLTFKDPEVRAALSEVDAKGDENPGCYWSDSDLGLELSLRRGWAPQRAFNEIYRFMGSKIIAGEMTFYSDDMLRTPMGFQRISGDCGAVPDIEAMRRDSAQLVKHFDAFIRWQGETVTCGKGFMADLSAAKAKMDALSGNQTSNVWMPLEYAIIGLGAGWVEGAGPQSRGLLRPPLCHYQ